MTFNCLDISPAKAFARIYEVRAEALKRARDEFEQCIDPVDDQLLPIRLRRPQDEPDEQPGEQVGEA